MRKILNLYACLGGNRYKWDDLSDQLQITAVELDPVLAELYQERFPNDTVIIADAHKFLLENFRDYDFIWSSPPCPSHSRAGFGSRKSENSNHKPVYPDLKLYEEIIFLKHYFNGKYCVENVIPYYDPLIAGTIRDRHIYWTNFRLPNVLSNKTRVKDMEIASIEDFSKFHEYDFNRYKALKGKQRLDKISRNLVDFEAGKTILATALNIYEANNKNQLSIF